jgi:hypothetical protein
MNTQIDQIIISNEYIENRNYDFLLNSKQNEFYGKNVFFTQGLKGNRFVYFQIIGNLGGTANDFDFNIQTEYYIIANSLMDNLKAGIIDVQLEELEKKLNGKGKKYTHLKIISTETFIKFVVNRCLAIGDQVTLNLINSVK